MFHYVQPSVEQRRKHNRLTMMFKIYKQFVDTDFSSRLNLSQSVT